MDLFTIVPLFIAVVFGIMIVMLLIGIISGISTWQYNNRQPVLTSASRVVAKRTEVRGSVSSDHGGSTSTYYYCTFEDDQGERHEFRISGREYGQLVEGDTGYLTYQGTRYLKFQRQRM